MTLCLLVLPDEVILSVVGNLVVTFVLGDIAIKMELGFVLATVVEVLRRVGYANRNSNSRTGHCYHGLWWRRIG